MITAEISIPRSGLFISPVQSFFKKLFKNLNYPSDIVYDYCYTDVICFPRQEEPSRGVPETQGGSAG
jgi:hypothetical protein